MHEIKLADGSKGMLFGVFDGHGGQEVSSFCHSHFKNTLVEQDEFVSQDYKRALEKACIRIDGKLKENGIFVAGCTACVVLITPLIIICANCGDSRAVLKNKTSAIALSHDHKPNLKKERKRIAAAGHFIEDERVDGALAMSRALGDLEFKNRIDLNPEEQAVTSLPDITIR